jgi:hypothetical protein
LSVQTLSIFSTVGIRQYDEMIVQLYPPYVPLKSCFRKVLFRSVANGKHTKFECTFWDNKDLPGRNNYSIKQKHR